MSAYQLGGTSALLVLVGIIEPFKVYTCPLCYGRYHIPPSVCEVCKSGDFGAVWFEPLFHLLAPSMRVLLDGQDIANSLVLRRFTNHREIKEAAAKHVRWG